MAWVMRIEWNAFSEALGHLKYYICRLGERAGERARGGRAGRRGDRI